MRPSRFYAERLIEEQIKRLLVGSQIRRTIPFDPAKCFLTCSCETEIPKIPTDCQADDVIGKVSTAEQRRMHRARHAFTIAPFFRLATLPPWETMTSAG